MSHLRALAFLLAAVALALAGMVALAALGAQRVNRGERVLVIFAPASGAAAAVALGSPAVRTFEPLGIANAWVVEADAGSVAADLRAAGARLVLRTDGLLHFALGCSG